MRVTGEPLWFGVSHDGRPWNVSGPPEKVQATEYGAPATTEPVSGLQLRVSGGARILIVITCEACWGPDEPVELSVTVTVTLYEVGGGLGAVPVRVMPVPVVPLG